jgi:hypothetical protein
VRGHKRISPSHRIAIVRQNVRRDIHILARPQISILALRRIPVDINQRRKSGGQIGRKISNHPRVDEVTVMF